MATIDELKEIFQAADVDCSGGLSKDEMQKAMTMLGGNARHRDDFDAVFDRLAMKHPDMTIDFQDFLQFSKEHRPS